MPTDKITLPLVRTEDTLETFSEAQKAIFVSFCKAEMQDIEMYTINNNNKYVKGKIKDKEYMFSHSLHENASYIITCNNKILINTFDPAALRRLAICIGAPESVTSGMSSGTPPFAR